MVTLSLLQFQWKKKENSCAVEIRLQRAYSSARLKAGVRRTAAQPDEKDQANKSTGWMPWHQEPKKDVASCEKPW